MSLIFSVTVSQSAPQASLKDIDTAIESLTEEIAGLPGVQKPLQFDAFGYHSGYLPALDKLPEKPRWTIDIVYDHYARLSELILVPAIERQYGRLGSYGFPKRFRISTVSPEGDVSAVCEWLDEDCPDPGRVPLIIKVPDPFNYALRMEVFRGSMEAGKEFFALDELFGVVGEEIYMAQEVYISSRLESLPYWGEDFLTDHKTSLGLPVGRGQQGGGDFSIVFDSPQEDEKVIEIDLGENRRLGWIVFFPAMPPEDVLIPGYGFPGSIKIEIIEELDGGRVKKSAFLKEEWKGGNPGNNVVRLPGFSRNARWVRIIASDLPVHNGKQTFALGEIIIHKNFNAFPVTGIRLEGFPEEAESQAGLMIDQKSNGRPVMFFLDWVRKITRREVLEHKLASMEQLKKETLQSREKARKITAASIGAAIVISALLVAAVALIHRRKGINNLRRRITRDLHDDVGSSLGSISLSAEQIGHLTDDPELKSELGELSLMAREACVSLREVVWVIDQESIRLPDLLQKLAERAERVLSHVTLNVSLPAACPDLFVSLTAKRHLIMFFKEVIHNCARHAQARNVWIMVNIADDELKLEIKDDGTGFDPNRKNQGWGLNSLKDRAAELGGKMQLKSEPGKGTEITLYLSLTSLSKESNRGYKTSN